MCKRGILLTFSLDLFSCYNIPFWRLGATRKESEDGIRNYHQWGGTLSFFNTAETSADISDSLKLRYSITTKLEKSFLITKIEIRFFKGLITALSFKIALDFQK